MQYMSCCRRGLSKRQATIEGSVFGARFIAMKYRMKTLSGLKYKLCMIDCELTGPICVYDDNMPIVSNISRA